MDTHGPGIKLELRVKRERRGVGCHKVVVIAKHS